MSLVVCVGSNFGAGFSNTTYIGKVGIEYHLFYFIIRGLYGDRSIFER